MTRSDETCLPSLADTLTVGISVHHPETGDPLDLNDRLSDLYGYSPEYLQGTTGDVRPSNSARGSLAEIGRRIRTGTPRDTERFEWQVERSNGERIWVSVSLEATTTDGTDCVIAEIRDITQYKSRERLLQLLSRIVRHNLRNDMTVLMGHADHVRERVSDPQLEQHLDQVLDTAGDVGKLSKSVRQIQDIANTETAQRSPTNVSDAIEPLVNDAKLEHPEVQFRTVFSGDAWVGADMGLQYAIEHALHNAIVHNDHESPLVCVETERVDGDVEIRIIDNGPPIPEMETEVLDTTTEASSTYHGSGVGLWVMKQCLRAHGGELRFERAPTGGNVVVFTLPAIRPPAAAERTAVERTTDSTAEQFGR